MTWLPYCFQVVLQDYERSAVECLPGGAYDQTLNLVLTPVSHPTSSSPSSEPEVAQAPKSVEIKPGKPFKLSSGQQSAVRAGIRERLKDPDSAKFAAISAVKDDKGIVYVCGKVNAKNSYGGYTGMSPFFGMLMGGPKTKEFFAVIGIGSGGSDSAANAEMCRRHGIILD